MPERRPHQRETLARAAKRYLLGGLGRLFGQVFADKGQNFLVQKRLQAQVGGQLLDLELQHRYVCRRPEVEPARPACTPLR